MSESRVVPVKLTVEMIEAGCRAIEQEIARTSPTEHRFKVDFSVQAVWQAILAASPTENAAGI